MDTLRQVAVSRTHVQPEPIESARVKIEILFGERVQVLEDGTEWVRVCTVLGEYEGFVRVKDLGEISEPTHRVSELMAPVYNESHFKSPSSAEPLYFNSLVTVEESRDTPEGLMHKLRRTGWVFDTELRDINYRAPDFLLEALKFLGTRYGYEKRGALIDCSTLVQAGCIAAGISCPYDVKSGEMEQLGESVDFAADFSNLRRGDLVFWTQRDEQHKGSHVGIMVDEENCFHATIADPHRKALIQPLTEVAHDQARDNNGPITKVRRFSDYRPS
ncbi:MAG: NlpC/P60 family protein [Patescibacteria group bacterium]